MPPGASTLAGIPPWEKLAQAQLKRQMTSVPTPHVSVCIAHYRGTHLLSDCIESVINQTCTFPVEIIVHDDASDPDSLEFLARNYPDVHVIASEENVGFCVANNRMVARATGDYVLLLNNDAALFADALDTLDAKATERPDDILTLPQFDWDTGELVDRGCFLDLFYNPVPNLSESRKPLAMVIGACLWVRRTDWSKLGGFPIELGSIAEDMYFCCAARLSGQHIRSTSISGYRHRQGQSFGGNRPEKSGKLSSNLTRRRLSERNKSIVMFTMTPTPVNWPLLTVHFLLLLLEGAVLSVLLKNPRVFVEVYWAALRDIYSCRNKLCRQREDFQRSTEISLRQYFQSFVLFPQKFKLLLKHGVPKIRTGSESTEKPESTNHSEEKSAGLTHSQQERHENQHERTLKPK